MSFLIDTQLRGFATAATEAEQLADAGVDGVFSFEGPHDGFVPLVLAAPSTRVDLYTNVAIALPRNSMQLAYMANDLQVLSSGRFKLGLGSQIKPQIEKRFGAAFDPPVARMRELVHALRAIFAAWATGERLRFEGEYYRHTLMTPMFDPGKNLYGPPPVLLAAVGPAMTSVAAEVADGLVAHAFTTSSYFRDVTVPAVERGLAASGRTRADFQISIPLFVVTGRDEAQLRAHAKPARAQLAFYGSTPAYRPVLDHHGWGDLGDELNLLSKRGEWEKMGEAITDEVLDAFAIVGEPETIAPAINQRFGGLVDRVQFFAADSDDHDTWAPVLDSIRAIS